MRTFFKYSISSALSLVLYTGVLVAEENGFFTQISYETGLATQELDNKGLVQANSSRYDIEKEAILLNSSVVPLTYDIQALGKRTEELMQLLCPNPDKCNLFAGEDKHWGLSQNPRNNDNAPYSNLQSLQANLALLNSLINNANSSDLAPTIEILKDANRDKVYLIDSATKNKTEINIAPSLAENLLGTKESATFTIPEVSYAVAREITQALGVLMGNQSKKERPDFNASQTEVFDDHSALATFLNNISSKEQIKGLTPSEIQNLSATIWNHLRLMPTFSNELSNILNNSDLTPTQNATLSNALGQNFSVSVAEAMLEKMNSDILKGSYFGSNAKIEPLTQAQIKQVAQVIVKEAYDYKDNSPSTPLQNMTPTDANQTYNGSENGGFNNQLNRMRVVACSSFSNNDCNLSETTLPDGEQVVPKESGIIPQGLHLTSNQALAIANYFGTSYTKNAKNNNFTGFFNPWNDENGSSHTRNISCAISNNSNCTDSIADQVSWVLDSQVARGTISQEQAQKILSQVEQAQFESARNSVLSYLENLEGLNNQEKTALNTQVANINQAFSNHMVYQISPSGLNEKQQQVLKLYNQILNPNVNLSAEVEQVLKNNGLNEAQIQIFAKNAQVIYQDLVQALITGALPNTQNGFFYNYNARPYFAPIRYGNINSIYKISQNNPNYICGSNVCASKLNLEKGLTIANIAQGLQNFDVLAGKLNEHSSYNDLNALVNMGKNLFEETAEYGKFVKEYIAPSLAINPSSNTLNPSVAQRIYNARTKQPSFTAQEMQENQEFIQQRLNAMHNSISKTYKMGYLPNFLRHSNRSNNMNGFGFKIGYKQFFGKKRMFGLRYYGFLDYGYVNFGDNISQVKANLTTYGAGTDFLYNVFERKRGTETMDVGFFAGIEIAGQSWATNFEKQISGKIGKINSTSFQFLFDLGIRTDFSKNTHLKKARFAQGIEFGVKIPTIMHKLYQTAGIVAQYRRDFSFYVAYNIGF
nr:outer membrane protein [Helicobacter cetorum]